MIDKWLGDVLKHAELNYLLSGWWNSQHSSGCALYTARREEIHIDLWLDDFMGLLYRFSWFKGPIRLLSQVAVVRGIFNSKKVYEVCVRWKLKL